MPERKEEEPKPAEVKVVQADQPAPSTLIGKPPEIRKQPGQDNKEEPARQPESTSTKPKPEVVTRAVPPPETKKDERSAAQALPAEPPALLPAEAKKDEQTAGEAPPVPVQGPPGDIADQAARSREPESLATPVSVTQPEPVAGERVLDSFGMAYRYIPGGNYTIGSPATDKERDSDEDQRKVSVKGFWLAETEMTQAEWKRHGFANPSNFNTCADCPVEQVSWYEAAMFANELSEKAGLEACYQPEACIGDLGTPDYDCKAVTPKSGDCAGYRLPTEEEWEVAARAQLLGTAYRARYGGLEAIAWYSGNSGQRTHPVGEKAANVWGLRDMLGNVWEWTNSPLDPYRVFRGGSWFHQARAVRAAYRNRHEPGFRIVSLGFRFLLGQLRSSQEEEKGRGAP